MKNGSNNVLIILVGLFSMAVSGLASAALPTEATAAFTQISGNVTDVIAAVWPILATVVGAFALMKLFKKGANKAV